MKFYAVVFGNWHGIGDDDVIDVFYKEEDAERYCDQQNDECSPDEWCEVREWNEEKLNKYWCDYSIS